jgi:predicted transcriptional regulator
VDRAAEHFAGPGGQRADPLAVATEALAARGITLQFSEQPVLRNYDPATRVLSISARAHGATQRFQVLHQIALLSQDPLLEATLDLARFQTPEARDIAKIGLANYFAGAALFPYRAFQQAARDTRHDLERLADLFGGSIEQVAHRLSTLHRADRLVVLDRGQVVEEGTHDALMQQEGAYFNLYQAQARNADAQLAVLGGAA